MKIVLLITFLISISFAQRFDRNRFNPQLSWGRHPIIDNVNIKSSTQTIQSVANLPQPKCKLEIRKKDPEGELLNAEVTLHNEIYYKFVCSVKDNNKNMFHCLKVVNCTVGNGAQHRYEAIDKNGCTKLPGLFGNVQYLEDLVAGVPNPFPIRFRGKSSKVYFHCVTQMELKGPNGCDNRYKCKEKRR